MSIEWSKWSDAATLDAIAELYRQPEWQVDGSGASFIDAVADLLRHARNIDEQLEVELHLDGTVEMVPKQLADVVDHVVASAEFARAAIADARRRLDEASTERVADDDLSLGDPHRRRFWLDDPDPPTKFGLRDVESVILAVDAWEGRVRTCQKCGSPDVRQVELPARSTESSGLGPVEWRCVDCGTVQTQD